VDTWAQSPRATPDSHRFALCRTYEKDAGPVIHFNPRTPFGQYVRYDGSRPCVERAAVALRVLKWRARPASPEYVRLRNVPAASETGECQHRRAARSAPLSALHRRAHDRSRQCQLRHEACGIVRHRIARRAEHSHAACSCCTMHTVAACACLPLRSPQASCSVGTPMHPDIEMRRSGRLRGGLLGAC